MTDDMASMISDELFVPLSRWAEHLGNSGSDSVAVSKGSSTPQCESLVFGAYGDPVLGPARQMVHVARQMSSSTGPACYEM